MLIFFCFSDRTPATRTQGSIYGDERNGLGGSKYEAKEKKGHGTVKINEFCF